MSNDAGAADGGERGAVRARRLDVAEQRPLDRHVPAAARRGAAAAGVAAAAAGLAPPQRLRHGLDPGPLLHHASVQGTRFDWVLPSFFLFFSALENPSGTRFLFRTISPIKLRL